MRRTLKKEEIDKIFEEAADQSACVELYKLAFPDWDDITEIDGWPIVGEKAAWYIMGKFMEYDRKHHPKVVEGGLWMKRGFSTYDNKNIGIGPWELTTHNCKVKKAA